MQPRSDSAPDPIPAGGKELPTLRRWMFLHKWSSLICTVFLLVICLTGLPLVFGDEIDGWLEPRVYETLPADTPRTNLDPLVSAARDRYPGQIVTSVFVDDDEPQIVVALAPSWAALEAQPQSGHFMRFDARTGRMLEDSKAREQHLTFMRLMLRLHTDLFVDLPGELFLGAMALLFVIAVVSGVVLYGPFTKRLDFGTVRRGRSRRLKWLDLHNLLGITTLAWAGIVGITGLMNELSTPLFGLWQMTDVRALLTHWQDRAPPLPGEFHSLEAAYTTVQRELPQQVLGGIIFPGSPDGSPHHYVFWTKGNTPLTARVFNPALVDAASGEFAGVVKMPWYLRALEVSRPLHFGDYGGLPLKILWALLDLVTIFVLGSGLYLWLSRRRSRVEQRLGVVQEAPFAREPA